MLNVSEVRLTTLENSQYVKPVRMYYVQNGVQKSWDLVKCHSSVAVILYNTSKNVLICVKQFRPGVYLNSIPPEERSNTIDSSKYPASLGVTLEFCAGIMDKDKSPEITAAEEVLEECGYKIEPTALQEVKRFRCSVGISGDEQILYYGEVNDTMKVSAGGGVDQELIDVVEISLEEAKRILYSSSSLVPGEFLYALLWFFTHKAPKENQVDS